MPPHPDNNRCGPVVLLDRDGTVIADKDYLGDPAGVELLPGAAEGLRALRETGCRLVIVTNQSGVGRGYFTLESMHAVNARMEQMLALAGVVLDGIYCCPHAPHEMCLCRKPRPGLVTRAAAEMGFIPREAIVIGDRRVDLALAQSIGARGILVRTGYGSAEETLLDGAVSVADDLAEAARLVKTWLEG